MQVISVVRKDDIRRETRLGVFNGVFYRAALVRQITVFKVAYIYLEVTGVRRESLRPGNGLLLPGRCRREYLPVHIDHRVLAKQGQ